jgi:glycogen debranching enzyme
MSLSLPQKPEHQPLGPGLYIRSNHFRSFIPRELFRVDVLESNYQLDCSHERARLTTEQGGWAEIRFTRHSELRITGKGLTLMLTASPGENSVAYSPSDTCTVFNLRNSTRRYACEILSGTATLIQKAEATDTNYQSSKMALEISAGSDEAFDLAMDEFWSTWAPPPRESADQLAGEIRMEFTNFTSKLPAVDTPWQEAAELAAYVLWSCTQSPCGQFIREPIFMSINWMDQVWSWDHCFNAMALAKGHPELAWDQWHLPFDHQDEFGAIPDGFNDVFKHYNFCKPPVHGWTVLELLKTAPTPDPDELKTIYTRLAKHTQWFLKHRKISGQTLPYYLHGNDSGWDNSTMFDQGVPLIAPDLASLLVVQCEALAELAATCGDAEAAATWTQERDALLQALIDELWDGTCFVPKRLEAGKEWISVPSNSLIPYIPVFLGNRLPEEIHRTLATGLARFVTPHGIATEAPDSPFFTTDGYWRGPIWAPSTCLIVKGLMDSGHTELAERIRHGFLTTCANGGFAENFNALTGEPLRDKAYTWTASVFLLLAHSA